MEIILHVYVYIARVLKTGRAHIRAQCGEEWENRETKIA